MGLKKLLLLFLELNTDDFYISGALNVQKAKEVEHKASGYIEDQNKGV